MPKRVHSFFIVSFFVAVLTANTAVTGQTSLSLGDKGPAGGIIFHIFEDGSGGLEAALRDVEIEGSNSPTWDVAAGHAAEYIWPNGKADGYLPDKDELDLLYSQKDIVGSFRNEYYWSSTEFSGSRAWAKNFTNGNPGHTWKTYPNGVRAIRVF
jgi:hypothetical protein